MMTNHGDGAFDRYLVKSVRPSYGPLVGSAEGWAQLMKRIQNIVVLGGGSAGFMCAVAFCKLLPGVKITLVHNSKIPVIGVGESTTAYFPTFLHQDVGLDQKEFFEDVRPSWKLGIKFIWGRPERGHFYYPFDHSMWAFNSRFPRMTAPYCLTDDTDASHFVALMERGLSTLLHTVDGRYVINGGSGYHIDNNKFLAYLKKKFSQTGSDIVDGNVVDVIQTEHGDVAALTLEDGRRVEGDFFIDCSGFRSRLLKETMGEEYVSYRDSLFCDTAAIGSWQRNDAVMPYTTAETMDHGWCWNIEFEERITRGYVFSSQFCDESQAVDELKRKNPRIADDIRIIRFNSGRYKNYWVKNVAAVGNAAGFVEPLEATALHLIAEHVTVLAKVITDAEGQVTPSMMELENRRYRALWDEVRDFLALHYKFNEYSQSEFWQECRRSIDLQQLQPLVDLYMERGPIRQCEHLLPRDSIFRMQGYLTMLIGQDVPIDRAPSPTAEELAAWAGYREQIRADISRALPVRDALRVARDPNFHFPLRGW